MVFHEFVSPCNIVRRWLTSHILDWHLLPCDITRGDIFDSLPGALGLNNYETWPLFAVPWSFAHFVDRHVSPGGGDWSEGKVLCKKCVLELMGRHVLNSLRELKAQRGCSCLLNCGTPGNNRIFRLDEPQLENCWYGYRCRTQRKDTHAVKLNVSFAKFISAILV